MLLRPGGPTIDAIAGDFNAAWNGRVSPMLLWDRHPAVLIGFGFFGLILLMWLRRLFGL
jgi:hypothetical protein